MVNRCDEKLSLESMSKLKLYQSKIDCDFEVDFVSHSFISRTRFPFWIFQILLYK